MVDRLLASPRFGERWGRHWLDLVRYAETRGHEFDPIIPNAYQYRDYVIRAFNADVPYDQFVTEHIAGDLLDPAAARPGHGCERVDPRHRLLVPRRGGPLAGRHPPGRDRPDRQPARRDDQDVPRPDRRLRRCHDHKFDAISQRDYYALSGFLISSDYRQVRFATIERERQAAESLRPSTRPVRDAARQPALLSIAAETCGRRGAGIERLAHELTRAETDRSDPLHSLHASAAQGRSFNGQRTGAHPSPRGFRP